MPPFVIDMQRTEDARDVVHRAVQALADGKVDAADAAKIAYYYVGKITSL